MLSVIPKILKILFVSKKVIVYTVNALINACVQVRGAYVVIYLNIKIIFQSLIIIYTH